MDIIVYSTPNCKYCKDAKAFFEERGLEYEEVNVAEDAEAKQEMIDLTGQMGVPVVRVGEVDVFVGWNDEHGEKVDALLA